MDGFKSLPKMAHFKEGGHAKAKEMCWGGKAMKKAGGGEVSKADIKQDKAIVKKAIKMHDAQEHHGEKTDLSKLKKGGRSKKAQGTVKKFKKGGEVTNVYEAKKSSGDKDNIKKTKQIKPTKAAAPSKAATKANFKGSDVSKTNKLPAGEKDKIKKVAPTGDKKAAAKSGAKGGPNKYKTGGKVKKYSEGKSVDNDAKKTKDLAPTYEQNRQSNIDKLGPAQKEEFAKQQAEATAKYGTPAKKKGGKIKCMADGGLTAEQQNWLGGADATDPFILARMHAALGTKPSDASSGGSYTPNDNSAMDNRDIGQTGGNIDDESSWGNVSPNAAAFNANIPGAGPSTPATAPSAPMRRQAPAQAPVIEDESGRGVVTPAQNAFNSNIPGSGAYQRKMIPSAGFTPPSGYTPPTNSGPSMSGSDLFKLLFGGSSSGGGSSPFTSFDEKMKNRQGK